MKVNRTLQFNSSLQKPANANVAFKGNMTEFVGRKIANGGLLDKFNKYVEFNNGCDLPFTVFLAVLFGAVLICRYLAARDKDERREILTRDSITVGTLVFARPPLKKVFALLSRKSSGLALSIKPDYKKGTNLLKKFVDYLKPNSGVSVMTSSDIASKYSSNGYKNGFSDILRFIKEQDGNLKKIFKQNKDFTQKVKEAYESFKPSKKFADASADDLINVFTKGHKAPTRELTDLDALMDGADNPLITKAKKLNSSFDFVTTFLIVPAMLGFALPKLLEKKLKESKQLEKAEKAQNNSQTNAQNNTRENDSANLKVKAAFSAYNTSLHKNKAFKGFSSLMSN